MNRDEALKILQKALPGLREKFGVKDLAIFGSTARNEAQGGSDVDVLVEFIPGHSGGYFRFFLLQEELEACLGRRVDLVTPDGLKKQLREKILAEAVHAT